MSQENVEVVRTMADVWNEAGWEGVADQGLLDRQVEYRDDPRWPEARSAIGPSAVAQRFVEIMDALGADAKAEVEDVLDGGGDSVVMIFRLSGEASLSGIHYEHRWAFICRVSERRITTIQVYLDPDAALEDAGLAKPPQRSE
jgi:ketosteroid isomerase-like protein